MAVRIRMKKLGRKHRPFYRICAIDSRSPRGGRVLEELGTYDPLVEDTDARVALNGERIDYWLGVGAKPSDKVGTLIKKYGTAGTHRAQQSAARERLAQPRVIPDPGVPAYVPKPAEPPPAEPAPPEAAAPTSEAKPADEATAAQESASEEPAAEVPASEATTTEESEPSKSE